MDKRRVVITGLGTVNPAGHSIESTWSAVRRQAAAPRTAGVDDARLLPRVGQIDFTDLPIRKKETSRMNRGDALGVVSAVKAALAAGWIADESSDDKGLFFGTAKDTSAKRDFLMLIEPVSRLGYAAGAAAMVDNAMRYLTPFALLDCMPNLVLHYVSEIFKVRGDNCCFLHGGAAGASAIVTAFAAVRSGRLAAALAGGFDCTLDRLNLARYASLGLLATEHSDAACRPFDRRRDGFLPGEAGAAIVLEDREAALARGAQIHGEILGAGSACEATVYPDTSSGRAVDRALSAALSSARIEPRALGFIMANGAGTVEGDRAEAFGIRSALGRACEEIPVTALKGIFGHVMAGSGALELMMALEALASGEIPPVCGCNEPDERCRLRLIREESFQTDAHSAAIVSVGLGGQTCALVVGRGDR